MELTTGTDQYQLYAEACEYYMQGEFSLVLQIIASLPESTEIHLLRGHSLSEIEKYSEAECEFRKALAIQQNNSEGILGMAQLYKAIQEFKLSAEWYERYFSSTQPDSIDLFNYAGCLYNLGRHRDAISALTTAHRLNRNDVDILVNLAVLLYASKKTHKAQAILLRALQLCPADTDLLFRLGLLCWENGDRNTLCQVVESLVLIDPEIANTLQELVSNYPDIM